MSNHKDNLMFDTMYLEGALFVSDLLEKAAQGNTDYQKETDYLLPRGLKKHDEYGRAFQIAQAQWRSFKAAMIREDKSANELSLNFVNEFLQDVLGFQQLENVKRIHKNQRNYPVSFIANNTVPIIAVPHDLELDTASELFAVEGSGAKKKSAFQLAQELLNASHEYLWAIVCNARKIRLLRDSATLTRPCFLEFDIENILSNSRYADFTALWRIMHASRSGGNEAQPEDCIWEKWRNQGLEQGTRVRENLRHGVTQALINLGTGFLQNTANDKLRQSLYSGKLLPQNYFNQLLRLVYRWLLLFTVEERNILHPVDETSSAVAARQIYEEGYSQKRLRNRCIRRSGFDNHQDLWHAQLIVFRALAKGEPALALPALGGLFAKDQCPDIDNCMLANDYMLSAIRSLRWASMNNELNPVDYGNMGSEELGSVYESLLELVPIIDVSARSFGFIGITDQGLTDGNARKLSGSYYTPSALVQQLITTALDPVIEQRLNENPNNPIEALLEISVIDPACGSGHFLLAAARRLAEKLAQLRSDDGAVKPADYRHALREVITHCIYGVDRNAMALELARTALWLEGFEPGRPLTFIDHHLICGDSLLGVMSFEQLKKGIPSAAYKVLSGDDKKVCNSLSAKNRSELKILADFQAGIKDFADENEKENLSESIEKIELLPDDTPEQIKAKASAWVEYLKGSEATNFKQAADIFVGAFLAEKSANCSSDNIPTTENLMSFIVKRFNSQLQQNHESVLEYCHTLCEQSQVLHWPLAFPHIIAHGGFDCVLGNPPWERIKLQEEEFFASRNPFIAEAPNKAVRQKRIDLLSQGTLAKELMQADSNDESVCEAEKRLYADFINARRTSEATSIFVHLKSTESGRFPLSGKGDVNTYALFSELIDQLRSENGRAGFIVPSGIATDDSTKEFFASIATGAKLVSLYDFENRNAIFPGVHRSYKFCLMTLGNIPEAEFAFFLTDTSQLGDTRRKFSLTPEDFEMINPNTRTCPIFRSRKDAEITRKIYRRVPVLIKEPEEASEKENEKAEACNPWGISFMRMLDMSNDSHLFLNEPAEDCLPLYEAKMIHQFDHRWASYHKDDNGKAVVADVELAQKQTPDYRVTPRYWVKRRNVLAKVANVPATFAKAYAENDEQTMLVALANWYEASTRESSQSGLFALHSQKANIPLLSDLLADSKRTWHSKKIEKECNKCPLTVEELNNLQTTTDLNELADDLMTSRSPRWLMGWRDITNATNERTVIASVMPLSGVGHTLPLFFSSQRPLLFSLFLANLSCTTLDFHARQKVGGTHLTYGFLKQFPVLTSEQYSISDIAFIVSRTLELTYTTNDMKPWAEDLLESAESEVREAIINVIKANPNLTDKQKASARTDADLLCPFPFDPDRRAILRAELDAYYAMLYGLDRDELLYILDPAELMGEDYPSETFRVLKNNEIKKHGEYRTLRLTLAAYDNLTTKKNLCINTH